MRDWKKRFLFSFMPIGLWNLDSCETFFVGHPQVERTLRGMKITTKGDAGGVAFASPEKTNWKKGSTFRWKWNASIYPLWKKEELGTKKADDCAMRVGFLFSGGSESLPLPSSLKKKIPGRTLSHVLFICAVEQSSGIEGCVPNPHHSNILNCYRSLDAQKIWEQARPYEILQTFFPSLRGKIHLEGFWIFGDSDNSSSSSQASFSDLQYME